MEPTVSYLCTMVGKSTTRDWGKLKQCLQLMKCTIEEKKIIGAQSLQDLYAWIDAAYGVHPNMRSHTCGCQWDGV